MRRNGSATTPSLVQTGAGPDPGLPDGHQGPGSNALAHRRRGGQEGRPDPGRLVRDLGRRHLGDRSEVGAATNPPVLRAPNGIVQDSADYWAAGKAYYDPAKITVPTLLVLAEWDRDTPPYMAQTLFPLLINSPGKRLVHAGRRHPHDRHGEEPAQAVRGGAGFLDEAGRS